MPSDAPDRLHEHAIELSPEIVQVVSSEGAFLATNACWRDALGYTPEELTVLTVFDVVCDESRTHCQAIFSRVLGGEDVGMFEVPFRAKDGRSVALEGRALRLVDAEARVSVVCSFRDKAMRRDLERRLHESERRLRRSEDKWRLALEGSREGVWDFDPRSGAFSASSGLEVMLGYTPGTGPTDITTFLRHVHPDDLPMVRERLAAYGSSGDASFSAELRMVPLDGQPVWILVRGAGQFDSDGRPTRIVGTTVDVSDRRRLEERLRESESRARGMLAAIPDILIRIGTDGLIREIHLPDPGVFGGVTVQPGTAVSDYVGRTRATEVVGAIDAALSTGQTQVITRDYVMPIGVRLYECRVVPLPPDEGLLLCIDRTDQISAAAALKASEERLRVTLETVDEGVITVDSDDRVVTMNAAAESLTGVNASDAAGLPAASVCRLAEELTGQHTPSLSALALVSMARQTAGCELALLRPDGRAISAEASAMPLRDAAGHVTGAVLVVRDVTAAREATRSLRDAQAELEEKIAQRTAEIARTASLLRSVLEASADGLLAVDRLGAITATNERFMTVLGLEKVEDSIANLALMDRWARETLVDPDAFLATTQALFATPEAHTHHAIAFKDGRSLESVSRPQWMGGEIIGRVFSFRDVTERRQVELHTHRKQRLEALGTLAGGIAHDLNNALSPVLLLLSNLSEEYPENARELDMLTSSATRAAGMVSQLLTFARGSGGVSQPIDANVMVQDIAQIARATFPKQIEIRTHLSRDAGVFLGDPTQVHQLLLNLCVNARDAMGGSGWLTMSVSARTVDPADIPRTVAGTEAHPGRYVRVAVEDTGTGIAPEVLDRMFEPFFTTKAADHGTGLGLSTALGIVKGLGGFVQVETAPRRGSCICVWLPSDAAEPQAKAGRTWKAVAGARRAGAVCRRRTDRPCGRADRAGAARSDAGSRDRRCRRPDAGAGSTGSAGGGGDGCQHADHGRIPVRARTPATPA